MYQTLVSSATRVSRIAGPVCITRLAMRPAKSFWKNAQDWRTTYQWFCHRMRLETLAEIAWFAIRFCAVSAIGRATSSTSAITKPAANKAANRPFAWRAKCQKNAVKPGGGSACSGGSVGFNSRSNRENMAQARNASRTRGDATPWRREAGPHCLDRIGCGRVEKLRVGTMTSERVWLVLPQLLPFRNDRAAHPSPRARAAGGDS